MNKPKKYFALVLIVILIIFIVLLLISNINNKENFIDSDKIITIPNNSGFFSMFFFISNHYLFCKKNNVNYELNTDEWLYKKELGWTDYFEEINLKYNDNNKNIKKANHQDILGDFTIREYKNVIPEIYKYNKNTQYEIEKKIKELNLLDKSYDSIYIRRGDKLESESKFYDTYLYLELLLKKKPNCKTIFLQTDDYNTFIDLQKYKEDNKLQIEIITLCDKNMKGMIVSSEYIDKLKNAETNNNNLSNRDYLIKNKELKKTKPFDQMSPDEKYNSFIELIIGIEILSKSNICICDYQSNVARFVKLFHNNSDNVYNIIEPNKDIDYDKIVCPAFSF